MAAHEDTNKPECNTNINNDRDRNFVRVYKSLEQVLNNKSEQFQKKVESLIEAWKQVFHYSHAAKDLCFVQLMDWTKFHTLNLVLNGDWKNYKDVYEEKLLCEVKNTENALLKLNNLFSLRCKKLAEVIKDPWGSPVLNRLLNNPDAVIGPKEIEFFCLETGYLVSHRLKKLCEQHCEDLALNFVSAFIRCLSLAESQQFTLNTTEQQKWFIMDIYVALLFKYKKFSQMITSLKEMSLQEGYELVKRFTNKRVKISKVWRHSHKIAQMACQIFVTSAVMAPVEQEGEKLKQLLDIWFTYKEDDADLKSLAEDIRRIVHAAESAEQMYIICEALHKKFSIRAKMILVELLVRGLTTDMNRLENLKHEENVDEATITKYRMSSAFDKLSRILEDKIEVARECALTGFSLTPTEERLKFIEDFARRSGCNVDETAKEWNCRLHPPTLPSDEVSWKCDVCGDYMSQPKLEAALNTTNTLLCEALRPEKLGLDPLLCDDLAVLLSSPKYHLLSWLLSWPDLHRMCVMYLRNPESVKNIVSVLEYAEPDYSLYMRPIKSEPIDEDDVPTGIEKGYEHFLLPSSEESASNSDTESAPETASYEAELSKRAYFMNSRLEMFKPMFTNNGAGTSKNSNTAKLRQFRKNTKRTKEMPTSQIPDKMIRLQQPFASSDFTKCTVKMRLTQEMALIQTPRVPNTGYWDITGRYHPERPNEQDSPEDLSIPRLEIPIQMEELVPKQSKDLCDAFEEFLVSVYASSVMDSVKKPDVQVNCDKSYILNSKSLDLWVADVIQKTDDIDVAAEVVIENSEEKSDISLENDISIEKIEKSTEIIDININSGVAIKSVLEEPPPIKVESGQKTFLDQLTSKPLCMKRKPMTELEKLLSKPIVDTVAKPSAERSKIISEVSPVKVSSEKRAISQLDALVTSAIGNKEAVSSNDHSEKRPFPQLDTAVAPTSLNDLVKETANTKKQLNLQHSSSIVNSNKQTVNSQDHCEILQLDSLVAPINENDLSKETRNGIEKQSTLQHNSPVIITSANDSEKQATKNQSEERPTLHLDSPLASTDVNDLQETSLTKQSTLQFDSPVQTTSADDLVKEAVSPKDCEQQSITNLDSSALSTGVDDVDKQAANPKGQPTLHLDSLIAINTTNDSDKQVANAKEKQLQQLDSLVDINSTNDSDKQATNPKEQQALQLDSPEISVTSEAQREELPTLHQDFPVVTTNENQQTANPKDHSEKRIPSISIEQPQEQELEVLAQKKTSPMIMLKEATVILDRINIKQYLNRKLRRRTTSDTESTENKKEFRYPIPEKAHKAPQGTFPLQDKNPRVEIKRENLIECKKSIKKATERRKSGRKKKRPDNKYPDKGKDMKWQKNNAFSPKTLDQLMKSPKVILEKLRLDDMRIKKAVLANVPGLNDLRLIRPGRNNQVVQVVQVPGGRPTSTVTSQNSQTSTQVTPHIQRVGQPRADKPVPVPDNTDAATMATPQPEIKPTRSQPSTLINILSHQVVTPASTGGNKINILSHHLVKPTTTNVESALKTSGATTSRASRPPRMTADWQIISQVDEGYSKRTGTSRQSTTQPSQSNDQNRVVQFVCKSSDTKALPVTSSASNRIVKVTTTQTGSASPTTMNSNLDQGFPKFIKQKSNDEAEALPKFQQAFGKSAYQNNVDNNCVPNNNIEVEKKVVKTTSVVQPIQGSVIYARQVPVGQAINLIPQGRGQVFRIATTNSDPSVIHSKMSALLAAALQGKPKNAETSNAETVVIENSSSGTPIRSQIVKPVISVPTSRSNNPQPNLSSTTLEQLREFDMVYKQVKERSNTNTGGEINAVETNEGQRMNVTIVGQGQKFTQISPVVVVSSYCNLQSATSPALSVTSQGSSSPCVTTTATSSLPKVAVKNSKGKTVKSTTTHTSKASPIPKPQQKPQEDEHTTQRIFDILAEYAEQLRNSPDLNNKPAPRRRSNPPTNPNQNSKRKKGSNSKKSGQCSSAISSDADVEDPRTMGSEDSSCGVVQISMQEEEQSTATTQTSEASSESCQPLILADSSSNQTRNVIIADSSVGEALKMPSTAVLVPGNYIMPVSMVKGGQQIAVVSGGSKILATVPARTGPNMLLFQSFLNQNRKSGMPTVKYSTIQPISGISSSSIAGVSAQPPVILPSTSQSLSAVALGQPITIKKINEQSNSELLLAIQQPQFTQQTSETTNNNQNISTSEPNKLPVATTFQKSIITAPVATSVISQTISLKEEQQPQEHSGVSSNIAIPTQVVSKGESAKVERVQSVLVTASSSNGPMLAHSPPVTAGPKPYKTEFFRIVEMQQSPDNKQQFPTNVTYYSKPKKQVQPTTQKQDVHQLSLQRKQAAMERELRLQKSLSEECEDLGVDEPSASDLFPEADLLFDNNQSPSFEHGGPKRTALLTEINKEESKLFSGDDSSSVGTSLLFEPIEYASPNTVFEYAPPNQVTNGQCSTSNDTGSSCEDNTILHQCPSISDIANSPNADSSAEQQPSANKYKYKYSNRKKLERHKQPETWPQEASSSEDTTGSTDMKRSSHSPDMCSNKRDDCEEEKGSPNPKEEDDCADARCEDSVCGRGARRISKKSGCSCCNGTGDLTASRKRSTGQVHMQAPHKKAFLNKKR